MTTVAKVKIWDMQVGAVAWDESRSHTIFEYDTTFLNKNLDLAPIKIPLNDIRTGKKIYSFPDLNKETYRGLPGLLADSLPDKFGNRLIEAWLAQQGRDSNSFNSVERLCYTGKRGMGALEYEPVLSPFDDSSSPVEINELVRLAKEILMDKAAFSANIHEDASKGLMEILRIGTSAGGARAKAIIAYNEKTGEVRSGQIDGLKDFEYWIIKFDGVANIQSGDPKGYGKIEYSYYLMAKNAGINMSYSKLLKESERAHFMTKRFDRSGLNKLHMQTLCALAHYDYNDPYSYSYEQAFQIMRQLKLSYIDMEELFRRMVFNVYAKNHDDHTKNISFLMNENGKWSLSPAYDMTFSYDPTNKWMKVHQMSINGKRDNISKEDILILSKKMNIKKGVEIIEKVKEAVSAWPKFGEEAEVNKNQINMIESIINSPLF